MRIYTIFEPGLWNVFQHLDKNLVGNMFLVFSSNSKSSKNYWRIFFGKRNLTLCDDTLFVFIDFFEKVKRVLIAENSKKLTDMTGDYFHSNWSYFSPAIGTNVFIWLKMSLLIFKNYNGDTMIYCFKCWYNI
jgi:hypothetical protein